MNETCAFCNRQVPSEQAQDEYWEPSFWTGDIEINQAVCPGCRYHLAYNPEFGDCETVKPITQPIYVLGFYSVPHQERHYFLSPPDQETVNHLARYRPGTQIVHSIMNQ